MRILDSRGQLVVQSSLFANDEAAQLLDLPDNLPNGLYFLEIVPEKGERQGAQFVRMGE